MSKTAYHTSTDCTSEFPESDCSWKDATGTVQIKEIVKLAPRKRQTLLFSATMTEQVQQLVTMSLKSPVRLAADAAGRAPEELRQEIVRLKVHTHTHARTRNSSAC